MRRKQQLARQQKRSLIVHRLRAHCERVCMCPPNEMRRELSRLQAGLVLGQIAASEYQESIVMRLKGE